MSQRLSTVRYVVLLIVAGLMVAMGGPAAAQSAPEVTAEVGLDGYVDPNSPILITVDLTSPVLWVGTMTAELGLQRTSSEIEVPAGGNKRYELALPAPGTNNNRQVRLRFTPDGADQPVDTVTVQLRFATESELVAVLGAPGVVDVLEQTRTVAADTDINVAEISSVTRALGAATYLVVDRGALDDLSSDQQAILEEWVTDGGRLVGPPNDLATLGGADGPPVTVAGVAQVSPYGAGEIIAVDVAALTSEQWSQVIRPTPGIFLSQNFQQPGFDLFQAATGDQAAGTPQIPWLLGGLVAYALLVGPVNFLVLRQLDRRDLVWLTIPALSAVAVFAFWLFGPRTAVAQVTHASAVVYNGETGVAETGLVMVAGREGEHTLGVPEGWSATPAGDLQGAFGPGVFSGTNVVATTDRELTFNTDSLEAVPVNAFHPVDLDGLTVTGSIEGRRVNVSVDNQTDLSFWFWGVGVGLTAVAGDGELEPGASATQGVQPNRQLDPWQAPTASAYWNRRSGFFDEGNEVWQIIEPLTRVVNRSDRTLFQGDPYFFGYTRDLSYSVTVDGRTVQSQGPVLVMVPIELVDQDRYSLGQVTGQLIAATGQEFIEEGFSPFVVGADEVFVRFTPPAGVTTASVRVVNPFGGGNNPGDVSVFDWEAGVFVDVVEIAGSRAERFAIADYLHPTGELIVKVEPRDFGEIFPSAITMEWTP